MSAAATTLSLENPVFYTYALTATIMILKLMIQPWITVQRMMMVRGGFRSPEDTRKSPLNPEPHEGQLDVNEYVDRSRRMNLNDLESIPGFLPSSADCVVLNFTGGYWVHWLLPFAQSHAE